MLNKPSVISQHKAMKSKSTNGILYPMLTNRVLAKTMFRTPFPTRSSYSESDRIPLAELRTRSREHQLMVSYTIKTNAVVKRTHASNPTRNVLLKARPHKIPRLNDVQRVTKIWWT